MTKYHINIIFILNLFATIWIIYRRGKYLSNCFVLFCLSTILEDLYFNQILLKRKYSTPTQVNLQTKKETLFMPYIFILTIKYSLQISNSMRFLFIYFYFFHPFTDSNRMRWWVSFAMLKWKSILCQIERIMLIFKLTNKASTFNKAHATAWKSRRSKIRAHQYSSVAPPRSYTGPSSSRGPGKMLSWWMMIVLISSFTWAWQETWSWPSGTDMSVGPKQMARL